MSLSAFRSQLRTNIPGDTRISGRFNVNGATLTVLEGKKYTVEKPALTTGHYKVTFGPTATELTPVKGLIACFANAVIANPSAANSRWIVVHTVDLDANGNVAGVTLGAIDATGGFANMTANDDICFECIVRDTEIVV